MIKFAKMHGLGNDFIVIDGVNQRVNLSEEQIARLGDRHLGIGFDQCLIVESSDKVGVDFKYKIYNSDGKEVGQCGNGARCLASFIKATGLSSQRSYVVATNTTLMHLQIEDDDSVTVAINKPILDPQKVPSLFLEQQELYNIPLEFDDSCLVHALSVGNPHAILIIDNPDDAFVFKYGNSISKHNLFPEQVNVGFMSIISTTHIRLRVYERGCGETMACGSGAVAAAAAGMLYHGLDSVVTVSLPGGDLRVFWPDRLKDIFLNGPTQLVFFGEINVEF